MNITAILFLAIISSAQCMQTDIPDDGVRDECGDLTDYPVKLRTLASDLLQVRMSELVPPDVDLRYVLDEKMYLAADKRYMYIRCFGLGVHRYLGMRHDSYPKFVGGTQVIDNGPDLVRIIKSGGEISVIKLDNVKVITVRLGYDAKPCEDFQEVAIPLPELDWLKFTEEVENCFETIRGPREVRYFLSTTDGGVKMINMANDDDLLDAIEAVDAGATIHACSDD